MFNRFFDWLTLLIFPEPEVTKGRVVRVYCDGKLVRTISFWEWYGEVYLNTVHWQKLRKIFGRKGHHLHHKTYKYLFFEDFHPDCLELVTKERHWYKHGRRF